MTWVLRVALQLLGLLAAASFLSLGVSEWQQPQADLAAKLTDTIQCFAHHIHMLPQLTT